MGSVATFEKDQLDLAVALVLEKGNCSVSWLQRRLGLGYNVSAAIVVEMMDLGIVSECDSVGKRTIDKKAGRRFLLEALVDGNWEDMMEDLQLG